jgi:hypothetical protein
MISRGLWPPRSPDWHLGTVANSRWGRSKSRDKPAGEWNDLGETSEVEARKGHALTRSVNRSETDVLT